MVDAYRSVSGDPRLRQEQFASLLAEGLRRFESRPELMAGSPPLLHTDFEAAFVDGQAFLSTGGEVLEATVREIGELVVTSGRIIACEVLCDSRWRRPLTRTIPVGRYPVILSSAGGRIACAMLRVRNARPARWEMATWPGQDPTKLKKGEFIGFSVDGGTGSFLDADQVRHLNEAFNWPRLDYRVRTRKDPIDGRWNTAICDEATGGNLFYFESGYGDGGYASYWGLDEDGEPVCLITDFRVLTESRTVFLALPNAFRPRPVEVRHRALEMAGLIMEVIPGRFPGRSLVIGFFGSGASAVEASLLAELGGWLVDGIPPKIVEGEGMTFSFFEIAVPRRRDPARAVLRVTLPISNVPMQAIGTCWSGPELR